MPDVIDAVRGYIDRRVFAPALVHSEVPEDVKSTVRNSARWLRQFRRVGDLLHYMDRFRGAPETAVYTGLKAAGLSTFEDIRADLLAQFGAWQTDRTRLDDFVVGGTYGSSELVIFAEKYDNRSGGILPIGPKDHHKAVFVKATLSGGKYGNQWLEDGQRLKYFLKSRNNVFKESYSENAAIINHPHVPVYAFVRHQAEGPFRLAGLFKNAGVHTEEDGSKWFELVLRSPAETDVALDARALRDAHEREVRRAQRSSTAERRQRLASAPRAPVTVTVVTKAFIRNPDVVAEVLERAAGTCEGCGHAAPFARRSDGTPYLEVHHKVPLAAGGDDTVENAVALCPNCHRNEHYGSAVWPWQDPDS
ncbi:HNH endonuclease [Azospirillum soli]|uniref:HNH endonuclease n=1 Tax=Azospirillum soli TaxID=1304799 RepID=UPI001AE87E37|nr:HNH endonuclease [Azospirillum soli]MBP2312931.1 5-methylcytosine-specific restriction protein A [Azospirillum soli]